MEPDIQYDIKILVSCIFGTVTIVAALKFEKISRAIQVFENQYLPLFLRLENAALDLKRDAIVLVWFLTLVVLSC